MSGMRLQSRCLVREDIVNTFLPCLLNVFKSASLWLEENKGLAHHNR